MQGEGGGATSVLGMCTEGRTRKSAAHPSWPAPHMCRQCTLATWVLLTSAYAHLLCRSGTLTCSASSGPPTPPNSVSPNCPLGTGAAASGNSSAQLRQRQAHDSYACRGTLQLAPSLTLTSWLLPPHAAAAGSTVPPAADVEKLTTLICSDPEAAGKQILSAVQAGGSKAQVAVFAIFSADCDNEDAPGNAYGELVWGRADRCLRSRRWWCGGLKAVWPHAGCITSIQGRPLPCTHPTPSSSLRACAGAAIDAVNGDGDVSEIESVSRWVLLSTAAHKHHSLPAGELLHASRHAMQWHAAQSTPRIPCCTPRMLRLLMLRLLVLWRTRVRSLLPPATSLLLLLPTAGWRTLLLRPTRLASLCA